VEKIGVKICSRCKRELPLSLFHRHKGHRDGCTSKCGKCATEVTLNKYRTDPQYRAKIKERAKKIQKTEKGKGYSATAFRNYVKKNRDKINEINRTARFLSKSGLRQILWERANEKCELCKQIIHRERGHSNYAIHHIDGNRENNSLDNLVVVCVTCHLHKLHLKQKTEP